MPPILFPSTQNILVVVCFQLLSNSFISASLQQSLNVKVGIVKVTATKACMRPTPNICIFTAWLLSFGFSVVALAVSLTPALCESQYRGQASHKLDATCSEIDKITTRIELKEIIERRYFWRKGRIKTITTAKFYCQLFTSIVATRKILL